MNSNNPLVSVIIPVYNCDRYLAQAIESVLAQTYRSIEVIIIDDGSTDNSAAVANSFGSLVRYYFYENSGLGMSRNRGIELAQGEFLAFIDSDDVWTEDKLSLQMAAFEANPQLDMVFGLVQQFISPELDKHVQQLIHCPPAPMPGLSCLSMLIKRDTFYRVSPFETDWKLGEFIDWYAKAMEKGLVSDTLPKLVAKRRLHDANMGVKDCQHRGDYVRILKAALDRRRAASRFLDNC
jgi:glycosyltransferase involved in cell wall biosynthesis